MLKFMRLMFQAPDGNAKKMILDVAYYWFKKNKNLSVMNFKLEDNFGTSTDGF